MPTPAERLAASLAQLEELHKDGRRVFRSSEFTRTNVNLLVKNGFLIRVTRGWLISSQPGDAPSDTTPWYASFWEFCARYCSERFGDQWHLSPEQSLLLHAESTTIPKQVIVYAPTASNNPLQLLFGSSLLDLNEVSPPSDADVIERDGLRLFTKEEALLQIPPRTFTRHPLETRVVLSSLSNTSGLLRKLLDGGRTTVAGRLAGAFRAVGRAETADEIVTSMRSGGYDTRETNPFDGATPRSLSPQRAPIANRLHALWQEFRDDVHNHFPGEPGLPTSADEYLELVDEEYRSDAYHSLSIEGYRVTPALIDQVRTGDWDPANRTTDRQSRDALAARGYWEAFQLVRQTVKDVLAGADAVALTERSHQDWYRALFRPSVAAGLIPASALVGYRHDAVYLRGSRHVPPRHETLPDAVAMLFELLAQEPRASVRAVLGHWLVGYIHPYPDGNGRVARFLMNVMLASAGFPWTVIRVDDRGAYMSALEAASVDLDIRPFIKFVADNVQRHLS